MPEYKNQYKDEQEVSEVILKPDKCALIVWVQLQQHFGPAALRTLGQANIEGQNCWWCCCFCWCLRPQVEGQQAARQLAVQAVDV